MNFYGKIFKAFNRVLPGFSRVATDLFKKIAANYKDDMAVALVPTKNEPGLSAVSAMRIRSVEQSIILHKSITGYLNSLPIIKKASQQGVRLQFVFKKMSNINGVESYLFFVEASGPIPAALRKIAKLFMYRVAYMRQTEFIAYGRETRSRLKEMLQIAKGSARGFKTSRAYRRMRRQYGRYQKNGVFYVSLVRMAHEFLKFGGSIAPDREITQMLAAVKKMLANSAGIFGYSYNRSSSISMRMLLSRQELFNIFRFVMLGMKSKSSR